MKNFSRAMVLLCALLAFSGAQGLADAASAERERDITGWERGSEYNKHYDPEKYIKIKGTLLEFVDIAPMEGMAPGLGMIVRLRDSGEKALIHLGPKWFVDFLTQGFAPEDAVKVKGVWAEIEGEKVFMASKLRKAEFFEVKFRKTEDGMPYWTMTPEEIMHQDERLED